MLVLRVASISSNDFSSLLSYYSVFKLLMTLLVCYVNWKCDFNTQLQHSVLKLYSLSCLLCWTLSSFFKLHYYPYLYFRCLAFRLSTFYKHWLSCFGHIGPTKYMWSYVTLPTWETSQAFLQVTWYLLSSLQKIKK